MEIFFSYRSGSVMFDSLLMYKSSSTETVDNIRSSLLKGNKDILNLTNIGVKGEDIKFLFVVEQISSKVIHVICYNTLLSI